MKKPAPAKEVPDEAVRLDKWLWFARFSKTRAIAQKLIERGQVTLNGSQVRKPSASVRSGDTLVVVLGPVRRTVSVRQLGSRRGPPPEARALYDEPQPADRLASEDAALPLRKPLLTRPRGAGRPTKRNRRVLDKFLAELD